MTKGLSRSLARGHPQIQNLMKQTFVATDLALTVEALDAACRSI